MFKKLLLFGLFMVTTMGLYQKMGSIEMVNAINAANPNTKAKLTLYSGVGHDSDTRTFNGTGMATEDNRYDASNMSI